KIVLIPNGVDEAKFIPGDKRKFKAELGIDGGRKVVLFLAQGGTDNVWKGGEYFKELYRSYQDKGWLWIAIGGNKEVIRGDYWELKYLDSEETKAKYLAVADVFVYPSVADNCPLVVLEAMSCGVPILTFNVGGLPELVVHKKTGYVANYKDQNDLEKGFNLIMSEKGVALDLGREARLRVENNYTLKQMVDSYIHLYSE
ncbi:glycosyltransferase, partial [Candidatus Shapirobacteria bacterium]|nr:glycosyltransferase [Candidatus Shapirobacteria bacterium]